MNIPYIEIIAMLQEFFGGVELANIAFFFLHMLLLSESG